MSVSLSIEHENGEDEIIPFAGQRSAEETLRPLAESLGMKHVPNFPSWYSIEPAHLGEVIDELRVLSQAVSKKYPEWTTFSQNATRIIDALEQLKGRKGWKASFG